MVRIIIKIKILKPLKLVYGQIQHKIILSRRRCNLLCPNICVFNFGSNEISPGITFQVLRVQDASEHAVLQFL